MSIRFTKKGDLYLDNGSIRKLSIVETIGQRIDHILRSKPGDYTEAPELGAYVQQYAGYPNTPATKTLIEDEVQEELKRDIILKRFTINVIFTPTSKNSALLEVVVTLPAGNELRIEKDLDMVTGLFTNDGLSFTPAVVNEN